MDLNYRIIWADDNLANRSMQTIIGKVKAHILSHGFNPNIIMCYNLSDLQNAVNIPSKCRDIDLIISDYNLGSGKHCTEILNLMAREKIYAELVLYATGANTLKSDLLSNHGITRITVLDRQGMDLAEEIIDIIGWHLDKEFDVESFRGIVLDESSKIDILMEEIIRKVLGQSIEEGIRIDSFSCLKELITNHLDEFKDKTAAFTNCDDLLSSDKCDEFIKLLDSRKKSLGIESMLDSLQCVNRHNSKHYMELQKKRNRLSHDQRDDLVGLKNEYVAVFKDYNSFKRSLSEANVEIDAVISSLYDSSLFE